MQWLILSSLMLTSAMPAHAGKSLATQSIDQTLSIAVQANSDLGRSVAYVGDANGDGFGDLLVGQPLFDNGATTDTGAAYLFTGTASGFLTTPVWQVQASQAGARFGGSVAGVGDVNGDGYMDFAVGAEFHDNGQTDEGAIFVYLGGAGVPTTPAAMLEGNQGAAYLGTSVAGAGDMNGDGFADIVGGAPGLDALATNGGAAMVWFGGAGTSFNTGVDVSFEGAGTDFRVGTSVSSAGDVNADGFADLITGAATASAPETSEGIALVYFGSSAVNTVADMTLQINQAGADFGRSVSGGGDLNGDGYSDLVVGVPNYDDGETDEGGAFVYFGGATPNSIPDFTTTSDQTGANLGFRVAMIGDADGDGYADLAVSAPLLDVGSTLDAGRTWVFRGRATGLLSAADAAYTTSQGNGQFGRALAGGDYNRDGYADLFMGVPLAQQSAIAGAGNVAVSRGAVLLLDATAELTIEGNAAGVMLGTATATGDVNGDGFVDLIVGKPRKNVSSTEDGSFSIYFGSALGLQTANQITVDATAAGGNLGNAVAVGDVNGDGYGDVIVGAEKQANGQANEGFVYIYYGGAGSFNTTADKVLEGNLLNAQFGHSVAFVGDVNGDGNGDLAVGAVFGEQGTQNDEGLVYVYFGNADFDINSDAILESNQGSGYLGQSLAGIGDYNGDGYADIAAGGTGIDVSGGSNSGMIFIWYGGTVFNTAIDATFFIAQNNARLGFSVAGVGDTNGDGYDDFVVGANEIDQIPTDSGAAYLLIGSAAPTNVPVATFSTQQASAFGGQSVAAAGDLNGDGFADLIMGAHLFDNSAVIDSGAAYVYLGGSPAMDTTVDLRILPNTASTKLGTSAASGDFDGDGDADLAIGATGLANPDANEGAVFVYRNNDIGRLSSPQSFSITPLAPVEQWSRSRLNDGFAVGMEGISPFGRQVGKLELEACPNTRAFGAPQCSRFVYPTWTDLNSTSTIAGIGAAATGLTPETLYHWRARAQFAPFTTNTGGALSPISPEVGPWRRMHAEPGLGDIRVSDLFFKDSFE